MCKLKIEMIKFTDTVSDTVEKLKANDKMKEYKNILDNAIVN